MATAIAEATKKREPADLVQPVTWEDWQAERARRQEKLNKERPLMRKCIKAEVADEYEKRKPTFRYKVTSTHMRNNKETGEAEEVTESKEVKAQNETEAWAKFCDKIKHWPSPHAADRTFEKLKDDDE